MPEDQAPKTVSQPAAAPAAAGWQPRKCVLTRPVNFGKQPCYVGAEVTIDNEQHYNYLREIGALKETGK